MSHLSRLPVPFIHRKGAEDAENIIVLIFAETPKIKKPHSFGIYQYNINTATKSIYKVTLCHGAIAR